MSTNSHTEIIAVASGKGGTGKTLILASLGFALVNAGHSVLMVDGDPGTDGLSLFLLGPEGTKQIGRFRPENTFVGILRDDRDKGSLKFEAQRISRKQDRIPEIREDTGKFYPTLISSKGIYGDDPELIPESAVPDLDRETFHSAVGDLFKELKESAIYDYVLVDTRGGFGFETSDICVLADSYIVVCEPDYTSFYQTRNLLEKIEALSQEFETRPEFDAHPILNAIIVNKGSEVKRATSKDDPGSPPIDLKNHEFEFRLVLAKAFRHFGLKPDDIYPVPLDFDAVRSYKVQAIPYVSAPSSVFSFATITAFSSIFQTITVRWSETRVDRWNGLVDWISDNMSRRLIEEQKEAREQSEVYVRFEHLQAEKGAQDKKVESLERELKRTERIYERELERSDLLRERGSVTRRQVVALAGGLAIVGAAASLALWRDRLLPLLGVSRKPRFVRKVSEFGIRSNLKPGFYRHSKSEIIHYVDWRGYIRTSKFIDLAQLSSTRLQDALIENPRKIPRVDLASSSYSFEQAALKSITDKNYDLACRFLVAGIRHDLIFKRGARTPPSYRLYDLLAGVSVRYELDSHFDSLIELVRVTRGPLSNRWEKWLSIDSQWRRRWTDRSKPINWAGLLM